jgi:sulfide:quinone oxidoreductase
MTTTLILGGGFGGLACARALRAKAPADHRIVLVDRAPLFFVGATKTWLALGEKTAEEITRPRASLLPKGIELVQADVTRIVAAAREAQTTAGTFRGDYLVIALGTEQEMGVVPGLAEAGQSFYGFLDALQLQATLNAFQGGRIVILIPRVPFPCPPGPYEGAMLLRDHLNRRGLGAATTIDVWTVEKSPMATAGPEVGRAVVALLEERGIGFHPLQRVVRVESTRRVVRFEEGAEAAYDLLITVPPHRVPRVLVDSWLAQADGWIPVDPATLAVKSPNAATHVYAIGDNNSVSLPGRWSPDMPLVLPKAGVMAAAEGEVVAANIAADLAGAPAAASFDGKGHCFIEVGDGKAVRGDGDFFGLPHPAMSVRAPDSDQYRSKVEWIEACLTPPNATSR